MKKLSLLVALALFTGMGLSSCKKCMNCSYEIHEDHGDHDHHHKVELPEVCDSKKKLDDAEAAYRAQFDLLHDAEDFKCERD